MTRKEAQMPMRCKKARVSWSPVDAVIVAQQRQYRLLFKLFPKSRKVVGNWIAALMLVALLGNGNGFSARQL